MGSPYMITEARGNLLGADVDALVSTVNTVGIMGKGIALQFKRAYPAMFKEYARKAKAGQIRLGEVHVWPTQLMTGPRFIINFPTKGHWRSSSKLPDIDHGLDDLVRVIREHDITSIAVPPLGCGNGGLEWRVVESLIRAKLAALPGVDVQLYAPDGAPTAANMQTAQPKPAMTLGRAALIDLIADYASHSVAAPSLIETQKLTYFLQAAGEPLKLNFAANIYGPYADNLRHALQAVEGHYVSGYGDGSSSVLEAEPLTILPGAHEAAAPLLDQHPETARRIERVLDLVEGFESAYAMELLASVHWLVHERPEMAGDVDATVAAVQAWSPRKGRMFTHAHIRTAWKALRDRGWLPSLAATH